MPRLNRLLLQDAYPDLVAAPSAKRVLRFPADRAGQARVAVSLPAGATISKAALSAQESLRRRPARRPRRGDRRERPVAGVHVSGDDAAAVSVAVEQALTATGLALPLLALAGGTQVAVELRAGRPGRAGREDARDGDRGTDRRRAPSSGRPCTSTRSCSTPGPVWIALRAAKGEAVWLAATASDGLRVVRTPDDGALDRERAPGSATAVPAPLTQRQRRGRRRRRRSSLDGTTLAAARDGDQSTYDLAAALQAHGARAAAAVPLTFTSTAAGTITVYPPHVEYDL